MERIIDNEPMTMEAVYEKYTPLIGSIANKFKKGAEKFGLELDDLMAYGAEGLIQAYQRFDNDKGFKFMTFCHPYISGKMQQRIRDFGGVVKFNRSDRMLAREIANNDMAELSVEEIMQKTGKDKELVISALTYLNGAYLSLDKEYSGEKEDLTLADMVGQEADLTAVFVDEFIASLPERSQTVVRMLMNNKTQQEIADVIGCNQVYVSRLLKVIREKYLSYERGEEKVADKLTLEEFNDLRAQGKTNKEIAESKGIHPSRVTQLKKKWLKEELQPVVDKVKALPRMEESPGEYDKLITELKQKLSSKDRKIKGLEDKITRFIEGYESKLEEQQKQFEQVKKDRNFARQEYCRVQKQLEKTDYELQNTKHAGEKIRKVMEGCISENKALWIIVKELVTVCSPK